MEQKQLTQFTFYDLYWDLIKQSDDSVAGRLIQNICKYMFTDERIEPSPDDMKNYFCSNIVDALEEDKKLELKVKYPKRSIGKCGTSVFLTRTIKQSS